MERFYTELRPPLLDSIEQLYFGKDGTAYDFHDAEDSATFSGYVDQYLYPYLDYIKKVDGVDGIILPQSWVVWEYDRTTYKERLGVILDTARKAGLEVIPQFWSNRTNLSPNFFNLNILAQCQRYGIEREACVDRSIIDAVDQVDNIVTNDLRGQFPGEGSLYDHWTGSYVTLSSYETPYSGGGAHTIKEYPYSQIHGTSIGAVAVLNSLNTGLNYRSGDWMTLKNLDDQKFQLPPNVPAAFHWSVAYHPFSNENATYSFVIDTLGPEEVKYYWSGKAWTTSIAHLVSTASNWTSVEDLVESGGGNGDFEDDLNLWSVSTGGTSTITADSTGGLNASKAAKFTIDGLNSLAILSRTFPNYGNSALYDISFMARCNTGTCTIGILVATGIGGGNATNNQTIGTTWQRISISVAGRTDGALKIQNGSGCTNKTIYIDGVTVRRNYTYSYPVGSYQFENLWFETFGSSLDDHYRCTFYMTTASYGTVSVGDYGVYLCGGTQDVRSYFNPHNGSTAYEYNTQYELLDSSTNWKGTGRLFSDLKGISDPSQTVIHLPNPGMYRIRNYRDFFPSVRAGAISSSNLIYNGGNLYLEDLTEVLGEAITDGLTVPQAIVFDRPFYSYTPMSRFDFECQSAFVARTIEKFQALTSSIPCALYAESPETFGVAQGSSLPGTAENSPTSLIKHRLKQAGEINKFLYGMDTGSGTGVFDFFPDTDSPVEDQYANAFDVFPLQVVDESNVNQAASRYAEKMWTLRLEDIFDQGSYFDHVWSSPSVASSSQLWISGHWNYLSASYPDLIEDIYRANHSVSVHLGVAGRITSSSFFSDPSWKFSDQWLPVNYAEYTTYENLLSNGSFTNDETGWTFVSSGGASRSIQPTGGFDGGKYLSISLINTTDVFEWSTTASQYNSSSYCHVRFYARTGDNVRNSNIHVYYASSSGSSTAEYTTISLTDQWTRYEIFEYGANALQFKISASDLSNLGSYIHIDGIEVLNKTWDYNGVDIDFGPLERIYHAFDRDRKTVFYDPTHGGEYKIFAGYKLAKDDVRPSPLRAPLPYQFSRNYSRIFGGIEETPLLNGSDSADTKNIIRRRIVDSLGQSIDIGWAADNLTASFRIGAKGQILDLDAYSFDDYEGSIGRVQDSVGYLVSIPQGTVRVLSSIPSDPIPHRIEKGWQHMWNMLPDFWINNYEQVDLDTFAAVWSGIADMASNMLAHAYQYDLAKSILTAPHSVIASNEVVTITDDTYVTTSGYTFSDGTYVSSTDQFYLHEDIRDIPYVVSDYSSEVPQQFNSLFDYEITASTLYLKTGISSSLDILFAPWITYDEKLIYSNFGYLLSYQKPESDQYRDAVLATMYGLFGSHTLHVFRNVVEAASGLPMVPYTGKIYYAEAASDRFIVGVEDMFGNQRTVELPGILTPSSTYPLKVRTGLTTQETITDIRDLVGKEVYGLSAMSSAFDIYDRVSNPTKIETLGNAIRSKGVGMYNTVVGEIQAESLEKIGVVYEQLGWGAKENLYNDLIYLLEKIKAEYHAILFLIGQRQEDTLGLREYRPEANLVLQVAPTFDHNYVVYASSREWDTSSMTTSVVIERDMFEVSYPSILRGRTYGQRQDHTFQEIGLINTSSVVAHFALGSLDDRSEYGRSTGFSGIRALASKVWKFTPQFGYRDNSADRRAEGGPSPYTITRIPGATEVVDTRASVRRGLYATLGDSFEYSYISDLYANGANHRSVYFDGSKTFWAYDHQTSSINDINPRTIIDSNFYGVDPNPESFFRLLTYSPAIGVTVMARVRPEDAGVIAELGGRLDFDAPPPPPLLGSCCIPVEPYCQGDYQNYTCIENIEEPTCLANAGAVWTFNGTCPGTCPESFTYCVFSVSADSYYCEHGTLDFVTCVRDATREDHLIHTVSDCSTCSGTGGGDEGPFYCCYDGSCFVVQTAEECLGSLVANCSEAVCDPGGTGDPPGGGTGGGGAGGNLNSSAPGGDGANYSVDGFMNYASSEEQEIDLGEFRQDAGYIYENGIVSNFSNRGRQDSLGFG